MTPERYRTGPAEEAERPLRPALLRGWRRRCPNCGEGHLMAGYLKVADSCDACGEAFHHQRADDGPAYLTILIVGHLVGILLHLLYAKLRLDPLTMALTLSAFCVGLSLYLLPRIKGAFVALQWARRMHGFGAADPRPET